MKIKGKNEKVFEIWVSGGGAPPPQASENIKRLLERSMETCEILKNFHEFLSNFDLKRQILIKLKANLLEF